MRKRLPPIFTISTQAVEFNFDADETYGKYQQRRIARPRAETQQPPPLASTPPPTSPNMCVISSFAALAVEYPIHDPNYRQRLPKIIQRVLILLGDGWLLLSSHHRFLWLFLPLLGVLCGLLGGLIDIIVDTGQVGKCNLPSKRRPSA